MEVTNVEIDDKLRKLYSKMKILERILGDGYVQLKSLDLDDYTATIVNKE